MSLLSLCASTSSLGFVGSSTIWQRWWKPCKTVILEPAHGNCHLRRDQQQELIQTLNFDQFGVSEPIKKDDLRSCFVCSMHSWMKHNCTKARTNKQASYTASLEIGTQTSVVHTWPSLRMLCAAHKAPYWQRKTGKIAERKRTRFIRTEH